MMLLVADQPGPLEQVQGFFKRTAGAETNVAIGLARLGVKVGWASRLGSDSMARYLLASMEGEGIDCSHVVCDPLQPTGFHFKGRVTSDRKRFVSGMSFSVLLVLVFLLFIKKTHILFFFSSFFFF